VHVERLPIVVLHHVAEAAVQHAGLAITERRSMLATGRTATTRLDTHETHALVLDEGIEHAGRVAAAADACDDRLGQPSEFLF